MSGPPTELAAGHPGLRGPVVVTGTDTGVGKTIVTAAIAAAATAKGLRVAVVKPGQTGVTEGSTIEPAARAPAARSALVPTALPDMDIVVRLAAPAAAVTLASYPDPLAPLAASRVSGLPPLEIEPVVAAIQDLATGHDLVLIEGAGGLLVPMGRAGWSIADLARDLSAPVVLVARAGLGTLNHTALTLEALDRRGLRAVVVIGAWPAEPELVHRTNLDDLPGELAGALPDGAGTLAPRKFRSSAPTWLSPVLHGELDPTRFRTESIARGHAR